MLEKAEKDNKILIQLINHHKKMADVNKDNKILMQLINHHKKTAEVAKSKVSKDI
jgi:hypothetical protein